MLCIRDASQVAVQLKMESLVTKEYEENLKIGWRQSLVSILSFGNKTFSKVATNYSETDIAVSCSCPTLPGFFTLSYYFSSVIVPSLQFH